ncbi:MAG: tetratricopeptide repeat protein, partial [Blastocatellia bacterium]|nr:tetratricopeptide repeat protein [Blastocatellia bacterium]
IAPSTNPPALQSNVVAAPLTTSSAEYIITKIKHYKKIASLVAAVVIVLLGYAYFPRRAAAIDSIAVLPFTNVGQNPDAEYISDGITESLINSLSQSLTLKVMSLNSAFLYKGKEMNPKVVGQEMGVKAVLTGRVIQRGDSLIISVELIDAKDNSHIWGERYDRKMADMLSLQSELARVISGKLQLRLTGEEQKRLTKQHTDNVQACQLYFKGRYLWNRKTVDAIKESIAYFEEAVEKDPLYALAYAGLADSYALLATHDPLQRNETFQKAKKAAENALALDNTLAEAYAPLAYVKHNYDWDWPGAEREFRRAIQLNPNYAAAHHWYAMYLADVARFDEALAEIKLSRELDPLSTDINTDMGSVFYFARQYERAIEQLRNTLNLDPDSTPARLILGNVYSQKGMNDEAIREYKEAINLSGNESSYRAGLAYAYSISGNNLEGQKLLDESLERSKQEYVSPFDIAVVYAGLGDSDNAIEWLKKAIADRSPGMVHIKVSPAFDRLRPDQRFQNILRRVGLAQ